MNRLEKSHKQGLIVIENVKNFNNKLEIKSPKLSKVEQHVENKVIGESKM